MTLSIPLKSIPIVASLCLYDFFEQLYDRDEIDLDDNRFWFIMKHEQPLCRFQITYCDEISKEEFEKLFDKHGLLPDSYHFIIVKNNCSLFETIDDVKRLINNFNQNEFRTDYDMLWHYNCKSDTYNEIVDGLFGNPFNVVIDKEHIIAETVIINIDYIINNREAIEYDREVYYEMGNI